MLTQESDFILSIEEDPWAPMYEGVRLEQLKSDWMRGSSITHEKRLRGIAPIGNVALVGAVRDHKTGKLNLRDELACRAIMKELLPSVPFRKDCKVDIFNLAENKDIFSARNTYDLVVFCNLREIEPVIIKRYEQLATAGELKQLLQAPRQPFGGQEYEINRAVADALLPSDILSGYKYAGISHEHKYYMTVSDKALIPDAYSNLVKKLEARFVACWGLVEYIHGGYFSAPVAYDLNRPLKARLSNANDFTLTQDKLCGAGLMKPFGSIPQNIMPWTPTIELAVRNDVLEKIWVNDREKAAQSLLFSGGVEHMDKLDLVAQLKSQRGRKPIVDSWKVAGISIAQIHKAVSRPLTRLERAERFVRRHLA